MKTFHWLLLLTFFVLIACKKEEPIASFMPSKTSAEVDEIINFANQSQHASSFTWEFGDGTSSSLDSPTHAYASDGIFLVQLTATGDGGSSTTSRNIEISFPVPVADFIMNKTTADAGEMITFTNLSEYADSYLWDFGDESTSTLASPTHKYLSDGTFTIQLDATGPGGTASISQDITISIPINILPGIGAMGIELEETWATIESKLGTHINAGWALITIGNSSYIINVVQSISKGVTLYMLSSTGSTDLAAGDVCFLIALQDNFKGQSEEGIMMGSQLSEVVAAYGDPDEYDSEYDSYIYDRLGIRFYYDESDIIDRMTVFTASSKKKSGITYPNVKDLDNLKLNR